MPGPGSPAVVAVSCHCTRSSGERNKQGREEAGTVPFKSPTHTTALCSLSRTHSHDHTGRRRRRVPVRTSQLRPLTRNSLYARVPHHHHTSESPVVMGRSLTKIHNVYTG